MSLQSMVLTCKVCGKEETLPIDPFHAFKDWKCFSCGNDKYWHKTKSEFGTS